MSSGGNGANNGRGGFDFSDPLNVVPHSGMGNTARRVFFDPASFAGGGWEETGLWHPPEDQETPEAKQKREEAAKETLRSQINSLFDPDNAQLIGEEKELGDATRGYHTDRLNRAFTKAERNTRFNLARQHLLGGSEDSYQQGEVRSDRDLGATRVDEEVRRALTGLKGSREDARLQGIGLVNADAGEEGVRSATAGLRQSFANASTANKADLTGDLFANATDAYTAQQTNAANRAALSRFQQQLSAFYPASKSTSSGRVTPTGPGPG